MEGAALGVVCRWVDGRGDAHRIGGEARVSQERADRLAAERVAAQAHRLAQSTAALGRCAPPAETITAALHESLHWLKAGAGVFYLLTDDRQRVTVAQVAGYPAARRGFVGSGRRSATALRLPNRCGG